MSISKRKFRLHSVRNGFVLRCDCVIPRVKCWVQCRSPLHSSPLSLYSSFHSSTPFSSVSFLQSFVSFCSILVSPTNSAVKGRSEYRLAASSCCVGNVRVSNFGALVLHTHGSVLVPGLELSPWLLTTARGER